MLGKCFIAVSAMMMALTPVSAKDTLSAEDIHKLQTVGFPALSPDGKTVLYEVTVTDKKNDTTTSDLWTVPFAGGEPQKFMDTPESSEWNPLYSPDGSKIAYLAVGDNGYTQIFIADTKTRMSEQVTKLYGDVAEFGWAPDNRQLVFSAYVGAPSSNKAGTPAPIVVDRFQYKMDGEGYLSSQYRHIHIVDTVKKRTKQITKGKQDFWYPAWSPKGDKIAVVTKDPADIKGYNTDVFVMAPKPGAKLEKISTFEGIDQDPYWGSPPVWSPDGTKLAWLAGGESKWLYYAPWQIMVADMESGAISPVAHIDLCFYSPKWSADSKHIFSLVEKDRVTHLAKINVETSDITYLTDGKRFGYGFDVSSTDTLVTLGGDDNTPYELYAIGETLRPLTHHNDWLNGYTLAKTQAFDFTSDGHEIGGLIVYPHDHDPSKKYPAIFRLHGGPVYQYSHEFMFDWQVYAANGYVVVGINPRGSSGKGFEFAKAIYANWGAPDSADILAGVKHLADKGIIDETRLGVGGWSYGGMLTDYVIATDTIFKAAISGAGTANMLGTYGHDQYALEYELELGAPWENLDAYKRVSFPFLKADTIKTATMFQCAAEDYNVPCLGSEQMYQALKSNGVDTKLIIYPGQNHGLSIPSYLEDRLARNLKWYDHYLK